jgi:pectinesterase
MISISTRWIPVALSFAAGTLGAQSTARFVVRTENALALARADETISIPWATVRQRIAGAQSGRVRVSNANGAELPSQVLDEDGDGMPEALIFQATFLPNETKAFGIEGAAPTAKVKPRTFALHDEPRDDVAWESDRIAFRIYGQGLKKTSSAMSSSGVDIWVKSVHELIIDKWYKKGHDAYHIDTGEGADFFDVGETLGAGGTGIWRDGKLHRADNFTAWRILSNGPIRTTFELQYPALDAGGLTVTETKRISIDAGANLSRHEITFRANGSAEIPYVVGVVKRKGMIGSESRANAWAWLTGWGPVAPKNGGHGELGTAVLLPSDRVTDWKETSDHYLAVSRATPGRTVVHYAGGGWTGSRDFRDVTDWWKYLNEFAMRLESPITVSIDAPDRATR